MGQDNSKFGDDFSEGTFNKKDKENARSVNFSPICEPSFSNPMAPDQSSDAKAKASRQSQPEASKKPGWLRNNARPSTATEVRRPTTASNGLPEKGPQAVKSIADRPATPQSKAVLGPPEKTRKSSGVKFSSDTKDVNDLFTKDGQFSENFEGERHTASRLDKKRKEAVKKDMIQKMNRFIKSASKRTLNDVQYKVQAPVMPEKFKAPEQNKKNWLSKLAGSKAVALKKMGPRLASDKFLEPMKSEDVAHKVEKSFGSVFEPFVEVQEIVQEFVKGDLTEEALEPFLFDEDSEKQLTTYEKWSVVRIAAEQVLQTYANKANSSWVENESWTSPKVLDGNASAAATYAGSVDTALTQGQIAMMLIDDGRLTELGGGDIAPILSTDLWQAIKAVAPYRVVLAVDCEQEPFLVSDLQQWDFFGLPSQNVVILPLPRFHGFAEESSTGRLAQVKGSYAMFLLNSPAEAYHLTKDLQPECLCGTVIEWLNESNTTWLTTGLFCDIERLRPEGMLDADFLAAAMYATERGGANMAVEVSTGSVEQDARVYDSLILSRVNITTSCANMAVEVSTGSVERDARVYDSFILSRVNTTASSPLCSSCNLRPSAMRTAKAYSLLKSEVDSPNHFFMATHRYAFKVSALSKLLVDASAFHADIRLYGFYAYAHFDMSDMTTFADSRCAAVMADKGSKGPVMADVVYGKQWLVYAAQLLEAQDKVGEFRQKAVQLAKYDRLVDQAVPAALGSASAGGKSAYQEKSGQTTLLLLTVDHRGMGQSAFKLAKVFVNHIVDRLHIVVLGLSPSDSQASMKAMLEELTDKELELNGQLVKEIMARPPASNTMDMVKKIVASTSADRLVLPSIKLCGAVQLNGQLMKEMVAQPPASDNMDMVKR
eukprot:gene2355-8663_t